VRVLVARGRHRRVTNWHSEVCVRLRTVAWYTGRMQRAGETYARFRYRADHRCLAREEPEHRAGRDTLVPRRPRAVRASRAPFSQVLVERTPRTIALMLNRSNPRNCESAWRIAASASEAQPRHVLLTDGPRSGRRYTRRVAAAGPRHVGRIDSSFNSGVVALSGGTPRLRGCTG